MPSTGGISKYSSVSSNPLKEVPKNIVLKFLPPVYADGVLFETVLHRMVEMSCFALLFSSDDDAELARCYDKRSSSRPSAVR